jgi:hypothetical protein
MERPTRNITRLTQLYRTSGSCGAANLKTSRGHPADVGHRRSEVGLLAEPRDCGFEVGGDVVGVVGEHGGHCVWCEIAHLEGSGMASWAFLVPWKASKVNMHSKGVKMHSNA